MLPLLILLLFLAPLPQTDPEQRVTVERLDSPPRFTAEEHPSFQESLRHLNFDALPELPQESGPALVVEGLRELAAGRPGSALELFERAETKGEPGFTELARGFVMRLAFDAGDYRAVFSEPTEEGPLGVVLGMLPEQSHRFTETTELDTLRLASPGTPEVEVVLGGERRWFILDTGAAFSVIPESEVEPLGVRLVGASAVPIGTSTSRQANVRVGVLPELRVGRLVVRDHAVFVIPDEALTMEVEGESYAVQGAVGWNAIRLGRTSLDYAAGTYALEPSSGPPEQRDAEASFLWMGYPLVRAQDAAGRPLLLGLDTGASRTRVWSELLDRRPEWETRSDQVTTVGIGGGEAREVRVLTELAIVVGDLSLRVTEVAEERPGDVFFLACAGVLGSDVARGGRMLVDAPAGVFELALPGDVERAEWIVPRGLESDD